MTAVENEAERKLIVALDMPDAGEAYVFWQRLALPGAVAKIGLELLFAGGVELARKLAAEGVQVFVDAKLFDIGNTVERATARVAALGATYLTVHAQDPQTVAAAVRGRAGSNLKLLGITLLTSAAPDSLGAQGITLSPADLVLRRARFAAEAGFDGVVSSPLEARDLKAAFGDKLAVVCPGIRPATGQAVSGDDQARASTPGDALRAGADYIVVGRPVTQASDPAAAARSIIAQMAEALRDMRGGNAS
jgi:orotidine-5'-phosphate decarboxylase